jgi:hypothetical protein
LLCRRRRRALPCALILAIALLATAVAAPAHAAALPADWQRGAGFTTWWHDDYAKASSDDALAALRATGTTHVSIVATSYMGAATDSAVTADPQKTPSDASVLHAMATARSLGMTVTLKPHVDVHDGTFRGDIRPASPGAWFASYREMLNRYADLARQGGAAMLVVGTELTSMSPHTDEWRRTIAEARARFGGGLTFAANWVDGAEVVQFWGDLDVIGIDAYMPLSDGDPDPSVDALVRAWYERGYVDRIEDLHLRHGKPVLFTEAGFESRVGTAVTPWGGATGPVAQGPQARGYQAAYCVWSQLPWFKGIYWWDWRATGYDAGDGSHAPRGKLAESTMRAWNAGTAEACPPVARPPRPGTVPAGPPNATAAAAPRMTLSLAVRRLGRRVRVRGRVRRGASGCAARAVRVVVERRRGRRWTRVRVLRMRARGDGRFTRSLRTLRPGGHRARAIVRGRPCGPASGPVSSRRVRFRVR